MDMMQRSLAATAAGTTLLAAVSFGMPRPAQADTASTVAIAAGAAAIVGALLSDGSGHPYYVRNNRRYYVTQDEASYYRSHHHVVQRSAWVPENEYPVARNVRYPSDDRGHR
jgi:hypothetical protein